MRTREDRERDFWDDHAPELQDMLAVYGLGPDPSTAAMLDAVEPVRGMRILDFACGSGLVSAWLAKRGACVTAIDLSPVSVARTSELCMAVGAKVKVVTGDIDALETKRGGFDRIVGRYALHHVDCSAVAPLLAESLVLGGTGAFLETMDLNPVLRFARRHLAGRMGIARYGTPDEQPLSKSDLTVVRNAFGSLETRVAQMTFLRILDRNLLRYKHRRIGRLLGAADDFLLDRLALGSWSFHQVLVVGRTGAKSPGRDPSPVDS